MEEERERARENERGGGARGGRYLVFAGKGACRLSSRMSSIQRDGWMHACVHSKMGHTGACCV